MYSLRYEEGIWLVVGEKTSRIDGPDGIEKFCGSYEECLTWLDERGLRRAEEKSIHGKVKGEYGCDERR
jgi:hypothetical protein